MISQLPILVCPRILRLIRRIRSGMRRFIIWVVLPTTQWIEIYPRLCPMLTRFRLLSSSVSTIAKALTINSLAYKRSFELFFYFILFLISDWYLEKMIQRYQCFCSNSTTYGKYGQSLSCFIPCNGDKTEICGGSSTNSIYMTSLSKQKSL